jgi:hypothetical protein
LWVGSRPNFEAQKLQSPKAKENDSDIMEISDAGKRELQKCECAKKEDESTYELSNEDKHKIMLLERFIQIFSGKKIKLHVAEKFKIGTERRIADIGNDSVKNENLQNTNGWGLEYDYRRQHYEKQTMSFSANGMVKTADGQSIEFKIDLDMKREYTSYESASIRAGDAKAVDPLVINLHNNAVKLTDNKISFDLDFDGKTEQVSFVSKGSGFLALDLNNDGLINDGRELFGPQSGDGFSELEKYDSDGNKWIDENDAVFSKLKIWMKDEAGEDMLYTLAENDIGALYIGNVSTPFSLKDESNNLNGEIQKTGIFLKENGTAGIIQHIDLEV